MPVLYIGAVIVNCCRTAGIFNLLAARYSPPLFHNCQHVAGCELILPTAALHPLPLLTCSMLP